VSGDGGLAILLSELITLHQRHLPVKMIVFNNAALSFVELEIKAAGIFTYGTGRDSPDFAAVARATGLSATRVEQAAALDDAAGRCSGAAAAPSDPPAGFLPSSPAGGRAVRLVRGAAAGSRPMPDRPGPGAVGGRPPGDHMRRPSAGEDRRAPASTVPYVGYFKAAC
jgi:Thiamine pyrophosphate enzyme, C-terminal TPP binding domain